MRRSFTRREFMQASAIAASGIVVADGLTGFSPAAAAKISSCGVYEGMTIPVEFKHGVASGDPTQNSVILWTRVSPLRHSPIIVAWEIATDEQFKNITHQGSDITTVERDYTIKLDAVGLKPDKNYYYRFRSNRSVSPVGVARPLPAGAVKQLKIAVLSCANYAFGHFHAYDAVAKMDDIDLVLHLGDYIYEYQRGRYPKKSQRKEGLLPQGELLKLHHYRARYQQYRSDKKLQALHAKVPFVCIWDDHEIANNTWHGGAENHNVGEGKFSNRVVAALQAYFEWLPIRVYGETPLQIEDEQASPKKKNNKKGKDVKEEKFIKNIYRGFDCGDLVSLHMLDTRLVGRDRQLEYSDYVDADTKHFDADRFTSDVQAVDRTMLGEEQLAWLGQRIKQSRAKWQVLGQQVLMGKYNLSASLALRQISLPEFRGLERLSKIKARLDRGQEINSSEHDFYQTNKDKLTPTALKMLQAPSIPFNLDAWDGYHHEREQIYALMQAADSRFIVLAGDTHNAWASDLTTDKGLKVGVEFATHSVTSPGLESYLGLSPEAIPSTESALVNMVKDLQYFNASDRGFMLVTFTKSAVKAEWHFNSDVKKQDYSMLNDRYHAMTVDRKTQVMKSSS